MDNLNATEINGQTISVCRAEGKIHGVNLYIKNLDDQVTEEFLRNEFSAFGAVNTVKIMVDEQNRSRGFAFVSFERPEDARQAISQMYGKDLFGKPIYVALAQPKYERRKLLDWQFSQRAQKAQVGEIYPEELMTHPSWNMPYVPSWPMPADYSEWHYASFNHPYSMPPYH